MRHQGVPCSECLAVLMVLTLAEKAALLHVAESARDGRKPKVSAVVETKLVAKRLMVNTNGTLRLSLDGDTAIRCAEWFDERGPTRKAAMWMIYR